LSARERSFGVRERESIAILIDDEEHVALVDELIIPHANIIDVTGNIRRDCNHIGANPGVSGSWRIEVICRQIVAEHASCNEQDESKQHAYNGPHWYLLQCLAMTSPPPQNRQAKSAKRASGACQNSR
jgi:hypothetical protein